MADTLSDKLSKAAKPVVDYAKQKYSDAKNLYTQGKALTTPIDKGTAEELSDKAAQIGQIKGTADKPAEAKPNSYKKGGKVKKSGMAKVHKGERVLTTKQTKKFDKKGGLSKLYGGK